MAESKSEDKWWFAIKPTYTGVLLSRWNMAYLEMELIKVDNLADNHYTKN